MRKAQRESWARCKIAHNNRRAAKWDRDQKRNRSKFLKAIIAIFGEHLESVSVVGPIAIARDLTRYRGPGWRSEERIDLQADAILRKHKEPKKVDAAQLEQFSQAKRQHDRETPRCDGPPCWCGLCHCSRCQNKREVAARFKEPQKCNPPSKPK